MKNEEIKNELQRLADENDGLLKPETVVEVARSKNSPLHGCFCWDDTEAAREYRLWQARKLIVSVTIETNTPEKIEVQAFVSLPSDRKAGGGYREIVGVMRNKATREEMLQDALAELARLQEKYQHLKELADVFKAVKNVSKRKGTK